MYKQEGARILRQPLMEQTLTMYLLEHFPIVIRIVRWLVVEATKEGFMLMDGCDSGNV